ncbi:MAG TPA: hypothetical protein PKC30_01285 [Saprospiraceae bacterium]|nr:hypothetical protein [Saprospiraceae bacterium]
MFVWQHHKVEFILKTLVRKGWKILHLKRINVLKQVFSLLIAKQVQRWVNTEPDYNPNEIYEMDPEMVLKTLRNYKSNHIQSETLMKVIDHLEVIYEYDLKKEGSWQKTAIKIFDFLEIENTEVIAGTYLTDQRSDQERIANFDEIITHLIQNGFKEEVDIYYRCENQKV